jgi:hypothetical protein
MNSIDTSGKALVEFWKRAGDKGDMNANTAASFRAACAQVLGVIENWETVDVRTLVAADAFRRFVNKSGTNFKQGSLQAYERRWPLALKSFLAYADDPVNWRPPASDKPALKRERAAVGAATGPQPNSSTPSREQPIPSVTASAALVEYPFPLREGRLAYLRLPTDLKTAEVKRLNAFLNTLAVDAAS